MSSWKLLGFVVLMSLGACRPALEKQLDKQVFRYNESAGITSLDPAFARNQANIWAVNQLFNGLVQLDEQLQVQPAIACNWTLSEGGCLYTFSLRTDVRFHDSPAFEGGVGRLLTAHDVEYSLRRLADEKLASPGAWIFGKVAVDSLGPAFHALNDSVFSIRLKTPYPPFLGLLSMQYCSVVPHEAVTYYGKEFRRNPVGTGPFHFKMWKENVKLVLLKNPSYFEQQNGEQLPFLDAIAITFIVDKQAAFLEFVKGNLDFMSGIDPSYKDEVLTRRGALNPKYKADFRLTKQPYLNTEYLGFLMDTALLAQHPLRLKALRQAINYGFDRVKMMRYLRNNIGSPGTLGMIPPGLPPADTNAHYGYSYQPERVRELLEQAGFPNGNGLTPITLSTNKSYLDLCQYIQHQLETFGIPIEIEVNPPATLREMMAQSKVPFFRASWIADYPDAENYLALFVQHNFCPQGPNYTHYANTKVDSLYRLSQQSFNRSQRNHIYRCMDSLIMQDAPVVVLYYDQVLRFSRLTVHDLGSNPMNLLSLKTVRKQ